MTAIPPSGKQSRIDFARPFSFVFEDPDWIKKVLLGGLFCLLSIFLIGAFIVLGYLAKLGRNVIAAMPRPLPEWDDIGGYLSEGVRLFIIVLIYIVPIFAIVLIPMIGLGIMGNMTESSDAAAVAASGVPCLAVPLFLIASFWIPAAMLFAVAKDSFGAAFDFGGIFKFIRENFVNYILAFLIYLVAGFIADFGVILLCVGVLFTAFWSGCVSAYAYADAYRLADSRRR